LGALERGGFLHDIGKIAVPDAVLLKDGKLDQQESRVMREHPLVGDALCSGLRSLNAVRPIVRHHHERLDGYDALTTERPYRNARPREEALEVLSDEASKGWRDRSLVDAFVESSDSP